MLLLFAGSSFFIDIHTVVVIIIENGIHYYMVFIIEFNRRRTWK